MGIFIPTSVDNSTLQLVAGIMSVKDAGITGDKLVGTVGSYLERVRPGLTGTPGGTTYFVPVLGNIADYDVAAEASAQVRTPVARTLVACFVYVAVYGGAGAGTATFTVRKAGADVPGSEIVYTNETGWKSATDLAAAFAANDLYNWKLVHTGNGGGSTMQIDEIVLVWRNT